MRTENKVIQKKIFKYRNTAPARNFYTPKSIAQCLAVLLEPSEGKIYDPCCGSGALLSAAQMYSRQNLKLYGQAQEEEAYLLSQIDLISKGIYADLGREPANALLNDQHADKKFDYIIANLPFNSANWFADHAVFYDDRWRFGVPPCSNANFAWLQHILSHLDINGRAAAILPNGTLTTQIYKEAAIREAIIRNNLVEAVIALPPGLFYSTKVPCCIWLLTNAERKCSEVLFVDTAYMNPVIKGDISSAQIEQLKEIVSRHRQGKLHDCTEWYGTASLETMEQNGFLLSPNLYTAVLRPGSSEIRKGYKDLIETIDELSALPIDETVLLEVISWKNAEVPKYWEKAGLLQIYGVFGGVTKSKSFFGKGTPLLDVKTVVHSPYMPEGFDSYVDVTEAEKMKYSIKCGDVLINRTSETIKELACCCVALKNQDAVYSSFIKRLRPCDGQIIDPLYASGYFRSEIYRWEVENVSTVFTTYASIDNKKLSRIAVYFPDLETQKKIGSTLYEVFRLQKQCPDELQRRLLGKFEKLLIQQYITYPVLCIQNKDGDYQCR